MHVIYIHQHFGTPQAPDATRSYEMSRALLRAGHRVSMICGLSERNANVLNHDQRVSETLVDGIRVYCIAAQYASRMNFYQRLWSFANFALTAGKVAGGLDGDLVFATSTPLTVGIPGMWAARKLRVPFVFEVRDLWPELAVAVGVLKNPVLIWCARQLELKTYRSADRIIALSPGMREGIIKAGYPAERVTMIPNGCDLDLFRPSNEPLNDQRFGAPDDFRLVFTGAHGIANGLHAVLDAAAELKRRGVRGVRFVFIGHGQLKPQLMARSRAEGLDELVSWVDPIPKSELAQILPRLDVGMMILKNVPAFYYGTSPNKFFDYLACGLPVLNNYPGWLADMIGQHKIGRAVPPDDPRAFAEAVLWLREHPQERAAMGQRARALGEAEFSRARLSGDFVKALEGVAAGR